MTKFERLKEIAIAMKPIKQNHRYFHVAFIMHKKVVRSIGWNDTQKTHPNIIKYPYNPEAKIHAEMNAILKLKGANTSNMVLVVLRLDHKNTLKNSKPCSGCDAMIRDAGFSQVWYSDEDQNFHRL